MGTSINKLIALPEGTTALWLEDNTISFVKPIDHEIIGPEGFQEPTCMVWLIDEQEWEYSTIPLDKAQKI